MYTEDKIKAKKQGSAGLCALVLEQAYQPIASPRIMELPLVRRKELNQDPDPA